VTTNTNPLLALVASPFFLSACGDTQQNKPGKDGYRFEQATFERTEFPVEIRMFDSEEALQDAFKARPGITADPKSVAAFSIIRLNQTKCTIFMIDPKVSYQPEFIGHELVHCIYGQWHQ
jgi:hypothetical protein